MKFVIWLLLSVSALAALFCLREGLRSLLAVMRRRPFLRRIEGLILVVEKTREARTMTVNGRSRIVTQVKFFPLIQFTLPDGRAVEFRSEVGEVYPVREKWNGHRVEPASRYQAGQAIEVFYDPARLLKPCIAGWSAFYGPAAAMLAGGLAFAGGSIGIWCAFGAQLVGWA
jgi:hypothetical protein